MNLYIQDTGTADGQKLASTVFVFSGLGKKYIRGQQCVVPLIAVKESIEYCVCDMHGEPASAIYFDFLSIPLYKSSQHKEIYLFYYVVPDQKMST